MLIILPREQKKDEGQFLQVALVYQNQALFPSALLLNFLKNNAY
jgi:hypothetical protein